MSKRVSLGDRMEDPKLNKAISAFTTNKSTNDIANSTSDKTVNTNASDETTSDPNVNKIIIKKNVEKIEPKRSTYYLMPETLKKISKLSKQSGVGKSALVQMLLDEALDMVEIK